MPLDDAVLRADDSAAHEGRGCYTTARVSRGRPRFAARHARRLRRDAGALGIEPPAETDCLQAFCQLAQAAFGDGEGAVRLQLSRDGAGRTHLVGVPRSLGPDPQQWRAIVAPLPHPGALPWGGAKVTSQLHAALARDAARAAGADEALLLDARGRMVEGARSNLVVVTAAGTLVTPPLARGGVAGIAREIVLEELPELREEDVGGEDLPQARELVALNALRGARPVTTLDARPVGHGRPGPLAARLQTILAARD
jgi:branched-subunit amino acid aminotransferase/4-amino-4-deoxychorismate lyase